MIAWDPVEGQSVAAVCNGRGPWWSAEAPHKNAACPRRLRAEEPASPLETVKTHA